MWRTYESGSTPTAADRPEGTASRARTAHVPGYDPRVSIVPPEAAGQVSLVNATPHDVALIRNDQVVVLPASGLFARVARVRCGATALSGRTSNEERVEVELVSQRSTDDVTGLPAPSPGVVYVVPQLTALAARHRSDLVFPHDEVRDAEGRLLGVRALGRFVD